MKKKHAKRLLALVLAFVLALGSSVTTAFAADTDDDPYPNITKATADVTELTKDGGKVVVTVEGNNALYNLDKLYYKIRKQNSTGSWTDVVSATEVDFVDGKIEVTLPENTKSSDVVYQIQVNYQWSYSFPVVGNTQNITVKGDPDASEVDRTKLEIAVEDKDGQPVEGVEFEAYDMDYNFVDGSQDLTYEDGVLTVIPNTYSMGGNFEIRLKSGSGYTASPASYVITVDSEDEILEVNGETYDGTGEYKFILTKEGEEQEPTVDLHTLNVKVEDADGQAINGVSFELYDLTYKYVDQTLTSENGSITIVPNTYNYGGNYELRLKSGSGYISNPEKILITANTDDEITAIDGETYDGTKEYKFVLTEDAGGSEPVADLKTLSIKVEDAQGQPLSDVSFKFVDMQFPDSAWPKTAKTSSEGILTFKTGTDNLPLEYRIRLNDDRYTAAPEEIVVMINNKNEITEVNGEAYDGTKEYKIVLTEKGSESEAVLSDNTTFRAKVVDKDGNPLSGVPFIVQLYILDDEREITSDVNGILTYEVDSEAEYDEEFTVILNDSSYVSDPEEYVFVTDWDGIIDEDTQAEEIVFTLTSKAVDKAALVQAINTAKSKIEADYTAESYAKLQAALAAANTCNENPEATQEEIDAQTAALNKAINELEKKVEPELTAVSVEATTLPVEGGTVSVTVEGTNLPATVYYQLMLKTEGNVYVGITDENLNDIIEEASLSEGKITVTLPANDTNADKEYRIKVSLSNKMTSAKYTSTATPVKVAGNGGDIPVPALTELQIAVKDSQGNPLSGVRFKAVDTYYPYNAAQVYISDESGVLTYVPFNGSTKYALQVVDDSKYTSEPEIISFTVNANKEITEIDGQPYDAEKIYQFVLTETGGSTEVDRETLKSTLTIAKAINGADYTEESYEALQSAITAAQSVYDNSDATQEEVDAQVTALNAAINGLELKQEVNKISLKTVINIAAAKKEADYTPDSFAKLTEELAAARKCYADPDATQEEVDAQVAALREATQSLVPKEQGTLCDENTFRAKVVDAEGNPVSGIEINYKSESWPSAYTVKTNDAGIVSYTFGDLDNDQTFTFAVRKNQTAPTGEIWVCEEKHVVVTDAASKIVTVDDTAIADVKEIVFTLTKEGDPTRADKTALKKVIAQAEALDASAYTEESFAKVTAELENAIAVDENADATQAEVDEAANALEEAISNLVKESIELPFTDTPEEAWYREAIEYVFERELMTGKNETTFAPDENLARAQFAVILHRMNGTPEMEFEAKFPDVATGIWYTDAILWASDKGIVTGYTNTGCFGPADNINREQMATMMYRYAIFKGYDVSKKADFSDYKDAGKVSGYADEAMQWAVGNGIITGKNNGTVLDPQGNATRAECATIMMRFLEIYE